MAIFSQSEGFGAKGTTLSLAALFFALILQAQILEPFSGNTSLTYNECISAYKDLAEKSEIADLITVGNTDVGEPLHLFVINKGKVFRPGTYASDKTILLINNGIHPGEPCGIDASVKFATNMLSGHPDFDPILDNVVIAIIPVYNIGGALNRNCCSRANQNGPEEYGFRGNAKNLDLNRDFIKCDSKNARSFNRLFHDLNPHVFIDTHTSNGADYQYVMTMITTQPDKATSQVGNYIRDKMRGGVYELMEAQGWEMIPYVHTMGRTPELGIYDFLETPRYSTGYGALFNCIGFTSETHMFKPFAERVESTYQFELAVARYMHANGAEMLKLKADADQVVSYQKEFTLQWELDTTAWQDIEFKGYEAEFKESNITGQTRLQYNRSKPWEHNIRYYDTYNPSVVVSAPDYYIIPQAWDEVIERLKLNNVHMDRLDETRELEVEAYHIASYETSDRVYEGHYMHHSVEVEKVKEAISFRKGDYLIPVNQPVNRYIVECLEPQSVDAFFIWNFFDGVLQQKEWFSDYIFEEEAEQMLKEFPELKDEFEAKRQNEPEFASNHWWQLYWLYQQSDHFESSFNRYPVYRFSGSL